MRRRRKNPNGKLAAAAVLAVAALAALLLVLPGRMPEPETDDGPSLVPVGAFAGRKNIYDRRLRELAVSMKLSSVYARPLELQDPEMIAGELATILERDEKELLSALQAERTFVWLGRRLEAGQAERIAALRAKGLYFLDEEQRYYPYSETAAHVLGFLSNDQGLAGIEFYYEQILQGGWDRTLKLPDLQGPPDRVGGKGGAHLVLTLDLELQERLERELAKVRQESGAAAAMGLVVEPATGEIHALANLPAFDPNRFWKFNSAARRNRVLVDAVYPGGLWNIFRAAAAAETEGLEADDTDGSEEAPFLAPRRRKTPEGAAPVHPDWAQLENGLYASAPMVDFSGPAPSNGDLERLIRGLEMGESGVDLPLELEGEPPAAPVAGLASPEKTVAVSALQLLTAFNRLIAAEGTAPPHLLKALWPADQEPVAVDYPEGPAATGTAARQAALKILAQGGTRSGGMVESLIDKRELAAAAEGGETGSCRQQDLLLGIARGEKTFTFLLVLDGACIDLGKPSLLRQAGRRMLKRLLHPPPAKGGTPVEKKPGDIYRGWRQVHDPESRRGDETAPPVVARMPDVRGHAVRQALQDLQPYGLPVVIEGSGRVTGQEPKAGTPLTDIERIRLELRAN